MEIISPFYISIGTESSVIFLSAQAPQSCGVCFAFFVVMNQHLMPQCDFIHLLTRHSTQTEIVPRHYSDFSAWLKEIWNDLLVEVEKESLTKAMFSLLTMT